MNPLIKKEIWLLLPAWIAAMLLAIVPIWIASVWSRFPSEADPFVQLALGLGVLLVSIASFGQEFSFGTFPVLLSQPMERRRIWLVKTIMLGIAFVSVLLAQAASLEIYFFASTAHTRNIVGFGFLTLVVAVIFSSGLWTTLLLRRMSEAFWLTLLTPLAIMVVLYGFHEYFRWSNQTDNCVIPPVLLLYSLAGFFWARRMFLRAQDAQWTGGEIAFLSRKGISSQTAVSTRRRLWLSALVWKELQLQQVNILIAGIVLVLDLASVVVRKVHPHFDDPTALGIVEQVWVLWLLMPLLIGSAAVAEEHRLGVVESQLCLPVSRQAQLAIKFLVGLILSVVVGGLMPFVIERTRDFMPWIIIAAAAIFFISFYASTLARTTIQAIGLAIVVAVVIYFYEVATASSAFAHRLHLPYNPVGLELLKLYLGVPILVLVLLGLMYWNFKWLHSEGKLRWRNGIAILASLAFIFATTNAIYFRVWEFLTPVPSPHGPVRLSASNPPKVALSSDFICAVIPDGRLWIERLEYNFNNRTEDTLVQDQCKALFVGASNWVDAAFGPLGILAVQTSGKLWFIPEKFVFQGNGGHSQIGRVVQVGSGTNWLDVAGGRLGGSGCLLLKKDGTLWNWGMKWASKVSQIQALNLAAPPVQIGNGTNWVEVVSFGHHAGAKQSNGSLWFWQPLSTGTNITFHLVQETNSNFAVSVAEYSVGNQGWPIEVKANGQLWLSWPWLPRPNAAPQRYNSVKMPNGRQSPLPAIPSWHCGVMARFGAGPSRRETLAVSPRSFFPVRSNRFKWEIIRVGLRFVQFGLLFPLPWPPTAVFGFGMNPVGMFGSRLRASRSISAISSPQIDILNG